MKTIKKIKMTPNRLYAGDSYEIELKMEFNRNNSVKRIVVDLPALLGSSRPSMYDQEDNGYFEVICNNHNIDYNYHLWDMEIDDFPTKGKTSFNRMAQRLIVLDVNGELSDNDFFIIKLGNVRDGMGIGFKAPTLVLNDDFKNVIDFRVFYDGTKGLPDFGRDLDDCPRSEPDENYKITFKVLPREIQRLRVIKNKSGVFLRGLDKFYNPTKINFIKDKIYCEYEKLPNYDVYKIKSKEILSLKYSLNNTPNMEHVYEDYNVYFGDMHNHSAFSNDCVEREKMPSTPYQTLDYAKNVANLDFAAVTDHHQPWDIERNKIGKLNWQKTIEQVKSQNTEKFIAFCGFEFRDNRGDTAVIFENYPEYEVINDKTMNCISYLWKKFENEQFITIPHFHNPGKLKDDEWYVNFDVENVLEIYSCHGSYEKKNVRERGRSQIKEFRNDRNGQYFLKKGYKYGFVANSDNHKGNIGVNGLTACYAKSLTKEDIFDAIKNRRTYLTSNARIKLLVLADNSIMGSVIKPNLNCMVKIHAEGENKLKYIEIIKNNNTVEVYQTDKYIEDINIELSMNEGDFIYVKVVQQDDHFAISSAIFTESNKDYKL